MQAPSPRSHETWPSRWTFIMAATGSAVGLGNIWKFPYIAGENGGGAFVLIYLGCILLIGIPVMIAEVLMGRWSRSSPVHTMHKLVDSVKAPKIWHGVGWMGVVAGIIILSYYSVIAGWALHYFITMLSGEMAGISDVGAGDIFAALLNDPARLTLYHTIFTLMTLVVVGAGVTKGLGRAVRIMMPILLVLLLIVLAFGISYGNFPAAVEYLFAFKLGSISGEGVLVALGHAFFTLSLGMGAIMIYGAYMPDHAPLGQTVLTIAVLDTLVALVAGLAIFPIVFASETLSPSSGPGLLFVSLPIAFGNMPMGLVLGVAFFALVTVAAWSSAISLIEPAVSWWIESGKGSRVQAVVIFGSLCWVLGLGTLLSFNLWEDVRWGRFNFFEFADFITSSVMLPLGGLLMAIFVGWLMSRETIRLELNMSSDRTFHLWMFVLRWVSPALILWVFLEGLAGMTGLGWLSLLGWLGLVAS